METPEKDKSSHYPKTPQSEEAKRRRQTSSKDQINTSQIHEINKRSNRTRRRRHNHQWRNKSGRGRQTNTETGTREAATSNNQNNTSNRRRITPQTFFFQQSPSRGPRSNQGVTEEERKTLQSILFSIYEERC